jgi:hypothetical protein
MRGNPRSAPRHRQLRLLHLQPRPILWPAGREQRVFRNNEITPAEALALNPDRVLISPGPCSPPRPASPSTSSRPSPARSPFSASASATSPSAITSAARGAGGPPHARQDLADPAPQHRRLPRHAAGLQGHPLPFAARRARHFPDCLEITAETAEGEVMGLRHRTLPIWGVQFHPESIATEGGMKS